MDQARQEAKQMVEEFLAQGGHVRKCPAAEPTTVADVLQYLCGRNVEVEMVASARGEDKAKYLLGAQSMNLRELLDLANRYRRRQRLPPFDLKRR